MGSTKTAIPCTVAGERMAMATATRSSAPTARTHIAAQHQCVRRASVSSRGGSRGETATTRTAHATPTRRSSATRSTTIATASPMKDSPQRSFWPDRDMDGEATRERLRRRPVKFPLASWKILRDCNDADGNVLTTRTELCDGIDQNCNGMIDEGVTAAGACPTGFPNLCAAGQNYCGGARRTSSSGFVQDWLIIGPFSSTVTSTVQLDARDLIGGEASASPTAGMMAGGQTWTEWRSGVGPTGALTQCNGVNLGRLFAPPGSTTTATNMTAYVYANIYSPSERMAELALGCDDGCRAWLNGTSVASRMGPSGCVLDDVRGNVRLLAGLNRLLIKVTNGNGESGVTARFRWPSANAPMRDLTVGLSPAHRALQCGQTSAPTVETCNRLDDNCDGNVDEGCSCAIGEMRACYTGRAETRMRGECHPGVQQCSATSGGQAQWGSCVGERVPSTELCSPRTRTATGISTTDSVFPEQRPPVGVRDSLCSVARRSSTARAPWTHVQDLLSQAIRRVAASTLAGDTSATLWGLVAQRAGASAAIRRSIQ
jgi:hypothetical protein